MATLPIASFSGLATGLDTNALVSSLVTLERRPITRLQSQQTALNSQSMKLGLIKSKMSALQTAARDLEVGSNVQTVRSSSSDPTVFGASAVAGASVGTYAVVVTSLAAAERTYSRSMATRDQVGLFGSGDLGITVAGVTKNVTVDPADTLDSVAAKINSAAAGVTASVIDTGAGFRLSVTGNATGAANGITFTEGGTLTLELDDALNQLQPATNAVFTVDGLPMSRASNSVANAIGGVTIDLKAAKPGVPVTLTVERDPTALRTKMEAFVKAYNDVASALSAEFAWTGKAKGADSLNGDQSLRQLQSTLATMKGTQIAGNPEGLRALTGLGISSNRDGTLTLDGAKLDAAMAQNPTAVIALLSKSTTGGTDGIMAQLAAGIDQWTKPTTGLLSTKIEGLGTRVKNMDKQMESMQLRVDQYEAGLRRQFASLEQLVSNLNSQGAQMTSVMNSFNK